MPLLLDENPPSNRLADLVPLVDEAKAALSEARPGEMVRVQAP
jgi:hypothetical protein